MKCDSRASLLAHTFTSPCLGRKPKARVAIDEILSDLLVQETNNSQDLKNEITFTFLIKVSLYMVAMIDEINNFFGLNAIWHGLYWVTRSILATISTNFSNTIWGK
jgi:hypothetical protein